MPAPRARQPKLESSLSAILATEASIRVLRVLTDVNGDWPIADLARSAGLTPQGARLALAALARGGIVEMHGGRRGGRVRLRMQHPLARAICELFKAERLWPQTLISRLRALFENIKPTPMAVWLIEPAEHDAFWPLDLVVGVLTGSAHVDSTRRAVESRFHEIARDLDASLILHVTTRPDIQALSDSDRRILASARPVLGPPPAVFCGQ